MEQHKWLIRGGWSVRGQVEVSGDSYSAIANVCHAIINSTSKNIENVPRSPIFLQFCETLSKIGFKIEWRGLELIKVSYFPEKILNDLTNIPISNIDFYELLVNLILTKRGECLVPLKFRKHLGRYRRLNFHIDLSEDKCFMIRIPEFEQTKEVKVKASERDFWSTLNYAIMRTFYPKIDVITEDDHPVAIFNDRLYKDKSRYQSQHSRKEFNFYTILSILTDGEVVITNADVSQNMGFVMDLYEIGASYEVKEGRFKIWHEPKPIQQYYNYSTSPVDELGYLLLFHTTHNDEKVLIKCLKTPDNMDMIKVLNMMGCQISYNDFGTSSLMLEIKPSQLSSFRIQILNHIWGGVILAGAILYDGNTLVSDTNVLEDHFPYFLDNLNDLGLKINVRN